MLCWAVYTVFSRPLLARHSPLVVTGASMIIGSVMFDLATWNVTWNTAWSQVSPAAWVAIVASAVLASTPRTIWYTAVQRLGSARTSVFSNMVPLSAMVIAALWLDEPIGAARLAGAGAILAGVLLTRVRRIGRWNLDSDVPVET